MTQPSLTILTQYYPPETGAPQNRLHSLACYLNQRGVKVNVVTAMPNYPRNEIFPGYRNLYLVREIIDKIRVDRTWVYVGRSRSVFARLLNYFSFVLTSFIQLLRKQRADYLLCESPPLFLGITAVIVTRLRRSKLIFNVSDLWPESAEKLGIIRNHALLRMAFSLEGWIYRNSFLITGQTQGILSNIQRRFPKKKVFWFPNGVDVEFFENRSQQRNWREQLGLQSTEFLVLYAGIVGYAQGLDVIIGAAHHLSNSQVKFVIVGDGPEKERLMRLCETMALRNVSFLPNIEKASIPSLIEECNAYVVPLKKLDIFLGAIPSKLFEPLALGKPILLGVDGEARQLFITEAGAGLYFEPDNAEALASQVKKLFEDRALGEQLGRNGKDYVLRNFDRNRIHDRLFSELWP